MPTEIASPADRGSDDWSKLHSGVKGWSPALLPPAAGWLRLMTVLALLMLLPLAVMAGAEDITVMPAKAAVDGNCPPLGMLATPPLDTLNAPFVAGVLAAAACTAKRWSTLSKISRVAPVMAALTVSDTMVRTSSSALRFSSDTASCACPGEGEPSGVDAIVVKKISHQLTLLGSEIGATLAVTRLARQ